MPPSSQGKGNNPKPQKPPRKSGRSKGRKGKAKPSQKGDGRPGQWRSTRARSGQSVLDQIHEAHGKAGPAPDLALAAVETEQSQKAARVEQVAILMAQGLWTTGPSHAEMAAAWGVDLSTVRHVAAEASRVVRMLARYDRDDDAIRASLIARAAMIGQLALQKTRVLLRQVRQPDGSYVLQERTVPDPDHPAALRAVQLEAQLLGLLRQTVELGGPEGGPIPVEAAAVVVLPAQNPAGTVQAAPGRPVETTGEPVDQGKGNGGGGTTRGGNGAKRGNGSGHRRGGGNGRGGNGRGQ